MFAYKLFRKLSDGNITSLFINKTERLPLGVWLDAKSYPTKGFTVRPHWHCLQKPRADHLTIKGRVWALVMIEDYSLLNRPDHQGGRWYLANRIKILGEVVTLKTDSHEK